MLEHKIIEIRDLATRIDVIATRLRSDNAVEKHYLRANGWSVDTDAVLLTRLSNMESTADPHNWDNPRTMPTAHYELITNWDAYQSGDVIDVEYVKNEVDSPKLPERLERM